MINNYVPISPKRAIGANSWSIADKSLSFGTFGSNGWLPKYEVAPQYTIVMRFEPRGGLCPLFFFWIKPKRYLVSINTSTSLYKRLYPWYYCLNHRARGLYIMKKRSDSMMLSYNINEHGMARSFTYQVNIRATVVDPEKFFTYLLTNEDNPGILMETIKNRISEEIAEVYQQNLSPSFIHHCTIDDELLENAGYKVNDCRIQYVN